MARPVIALIDDDRNITASLKILLEGEGFDVHLADNGEDGLQTLLRSPAPDLAVMDVKMPRLDGFEVLTRLRESGSRVPVIMLTSKDDEVDEALGFRLGADDYIAKPFSQKLLLARIQAVLRRAFAPARPADVLAHAGPGLVLDDARHVCLWAGRDLHLTVTEYLLLKSLASRPGMVKTRDQLIDAAYGENQAVDDRVIDTHIKRLRRKFKDIDPSFDAIETLYGLGYRYTAPPGAA